MKPSLPLFLSLSSSLFFSLSVSPSSLTWLPIRQRAGVIMVIWGDLLGKFCSSVLAISTKDPRVSREEGGLRGAGAWRGGGFRINSSAVLLHIYTFHCANRRIESRRSERWRVTFYVSALIKTTHACVLLFNMGRIHSSQASVCSFVCLFVPRCDVKFVFLQPFGHIVVAD